MKMALSDELLMKVEQPARYLGNEVNAANKVNQRQRYPSVCVFRMFTRWYVSSWNPDSI